MKVKDIINRALVMSDEVGNEEEYRNQLIEAINQVQNKLVLFAKNLIKYSELTTDNKVLQLPNDCYELMQIKDSNLNNVNYIKINNKEVKVAVDGDYTIKYKAYLPNITETTNENFEIEIEEIAEPCMVTGVASWITIDNVELYDVLNNEYNNLLANLSQMQEIINENQGEVERVGGWYW